MRGSIDGQQANAQVGILCRFHKQVMLVGNGVQMEAKHLNGCGPDPGIFRAQQFSKQIRMDPVEARSHPQGLQLGMFDHLRFTLEF